MSDKKDVAVSPDVIEEKSVDKAEEKKKNPPRAKDYIFINHMMRSARSGLKRHMRSGNRRQGVILDNGQRLRRRGNRLMNEVNLRTLVECHHKLLGYLESGIIEAIDPHTQKVMTIEQVIAKIKEVGYRMNLKQDLLVAYDTPISEAGLPDPNSTQPNIKVMEELAKTPEATGQDETPPEDNVEPNEGLTEDDLVKLSRSKLNDTAMEYGIEDPGSYKTKQDVIDAIFEAQAGEES